ncbi:T9SS type A sorting domain-containing protein [Flavobacterium sp. CYK-55]|uniref:endo-beta-N-acetylglucosaminidase n=1 Tax=Flavobacterium sp. CYK-55 TaxID=2835529 RepID=UPI001BCB1F31|nr:T9SS type A sorting domain-containing protein [Flavobacterium sp. CYK-55]MBS7785951.1 T9SS type A sorting domain-containing protein [Flavobacterium sp. CYK-55]
MNTLKKNTLFLLLLAGMHSHAQIINSAPYILTVDEAKQWTQTGPTASTDLIAAVALAPRFTDASTQFNPALTHQMKIAYLPDGMNNFGNYFGEQSQFNLYNFTHWQYIDKLVWFGGTASQTLQLPSSPWVNAAHRNGVKVFGNVFFAPTAFGGSTTTLTNFLEQDGSGNFIILPKMIDMMQYYGFDGWFINEETATNATTALLMRDFVKALTAAAEAVGKEVMWYDAMRLTGAVGWQNRLNANNSPLVQDDADGDTANGFESRVSSSIFINFFWSGATLPATSRARAATIGRSEFDVFTGADIWPGRNQGDFETSGNIFMSNLHQTDGTTPVTSLGLFAPNCVYNNSTYTNFNNDPNDYATFYNAENHLFSGDDNNPATVDASGFKGLCNWIPESTVIGSDQFSTNFSTGHGTKKFSLGNQISANSWHDMNQQNILPTWQWAFSENNLLSARWDFDDAFAGGNSIKISGNLPANHPVDLMLYKVSLDGTGGMDPFVFSSRVAYKNASPEANLKLIVVFADEPNTRYAFPILESFDLFNGWKFSDVDLAPNSDFYSRKMIAVGLRFESESAISDLNVHFGSLEINGFVLLANAQNVKNNHFVTLSYPEKQNSVLFNISWPNAKQIDYTVSDLQGKIIRQNNIALNGSTNYTFQTTDLAAGIYIVKFKDQNNQTETRKMIIK